MFFDVLKFHVAVVTDFGQVANILESIIGEGSALFFEVTDLKLETKSIKHFGVSSSQLHILLQVFKSVIEVLSGLEFSRKMNEVIDRLGALEAVEPEEQLIVARIPSFVLLLGLGLLLKQVFQETGVPLLFEASAQEVSNGFFNE
jgi:hypothetical protein